MAENRESEKYLLHKCIFQGDVKTLSSLIKTCNVAEKDKQGNTPLHLAVMLGRKESIQLLLAHGAPLRVRNLAGWSPLAEAVSYGDRETILLLVSKLQEQTKEHIEERRPTLLATLRQIGDFYMELKWDFQTWVPFFSRMLPSDVCKIYKRGTSIRVDTTLRDFDEMKWDRGDMSLIFNGDQKPGKSLTILDNKAKIFERIRYEDMELELQDEVDDLMSNDIVTTQIITKGITLSKAQTGWIFREDKRDIMVGPFHADCYQISGMVFQSKKRREHLSAEDLRKNKAMVESLRKGKSHEFARGERNTRRASLNPPPGSSITWEEYITAPPGQCPLLARNHVSKKSSRSFNATVAMSSDFPLTLDMLLNVLEAIGSFKHFNKLREFVLMKLPPGFPVKIDIPIYPMVTARVTFQEFAFSNDIDPHLFQIPPDYCEKSMKKRL